MDEYKRIKAAIMEDTKIAMLLKKPPPPIVYQYRCFESAWAIIKSDSFWATNSRFSNDSVEQTFAMLLANKRIRESAAKGMIHPTTPPFSKDELRIDDNYIVCFCAEGDKLSQWRGYAPNGGCSIGLEFNGYESFYFESESVKSKANLLQTYACLIPVAYMSEDVESYAGGVAGGTVVLESIKALFSDEIGRPNMREGILETLRKLSPYVKHSGFQEENEWRLVFPLQDLRSNYIRYRSIENSGVRCPYVVAKAGIPGLKDEVYAIRVSVNDMKLEEETVARLRAEMPRKKKRIHGCHSCGHSNSPMPRDFCWGCVLRKPHILPTLERSCRGGSQEKHLNFDLSRSTNCVVISQGKDQEKVYEKVHRVVEKLQAGKSAQPPIRVWCEGHLPIRSIKIGPCVNQENTVEAFKHYCKHTYWLNDVEITASSIPFRRTL